MSNPKVSIYDIAHAGNVSVATVSNVLNSKGRVSPATGERISSLAQEMGYIPSLAAKTLGKNQTYTIGIITPDVSNEFFSNIVLEVETQLYEHGYTSYICNTGNDPLRENKYMQDLMQRNVDGLVLAGGTSDLGASSIPSSVPYVAIDRNSSNSSHFKGSCALVGNDVRSMTHDMTCFLAQHGCQRIAFLISSKGWVIAPENNRYGCYLDALNDCGMHLDKNLILWGPHAMSSRTEACRLVADSLSEGIEMDGIVAMGDRVALGAVEELRARDIAIGTDVKIIGMDNSPYARICRPSITTVDRGTKRMANEAVRALLGLIEKKRISVLNVTVPYRIVERETTMDPIQNLPFNVDR